MARKFHPRRRRGVNWSSIGSLRRSTFARGFWSMLLKAALEPELLVVGRPRSTYRPATVRSCIFIRPSTLALSSWCWSARLARKPEEPMSQKSWSRRDRSLLREAFEKRPSIIYRSDFGWNIHARIISINQDSSAGRGGGRKRNRYREVTSSLEARRNLRRAISVRSRELTAFRLYYYVNY